MGNSFTSENFYQSVWMLVNSWKGSLLVDGFFWKFHASHQPLKALLVACSNVFPLGQESCDALDLYSNNKMMTDWSSNCVCACIFFFLFVDNIKEK